MIKCEKRSIAAIAEGETRIVIIIHLHRRFCREVRVRAIVHLTRTEVLEHITFANP